MKDFTELSELTKLIREMTAEAINQGYTLKTVEASDYGGNTIYISFLLVREE